MTSAIQHIFVLVPKPPWSAPLPWEPLVSWATLPKQTSRGPWYFFLPASLSRDGRLTFFSIDKSPPSLSTNWCCLGNKFLTSPKKLVATTPGKQLQLLEQPEG